MRYSVVRPRLWSALQWPIYSGALGVAVKIWVSVRILVSMYASLTYILKIKGPIFQGVGVAKANSGQCDVGREVHGR
jgi:hypothetical protein